MHRITRPIVVFLLGAAAACAPAERAAPAGDPPEPRDPIAPILLVGVDGATFDRIRPLAGAGSLPAFAELMERGCAVPLETLEPTVSPAIWTTIATGRLPEDHGIHGFEGVPGQTMQTLPTSGMRRVRAFWNVLAEQGRSAGVVGWWATWPAEPIDGWIVSDRTMYTRMEATLGEDTIRPGEVHPAELGEFVRGFVRSPADVTPADLRRFVDAPERELAMNLVAEYEHGRLLPELRYVFQSDRSTVELAEALMAERPVDVTAVGLYGVDTVSHLSWHFSEPGRFPGLDVPAPLIERFGGVIDRYYETVDAWLARLIAAAGENAIVIVFSDHGFGPTGNLPWSGGHGRITPGAPVAPDGILIAAGPGVRADCRLDRAHVLDVAPTVLAFEGIAPSDEMRGRVLRELFDDATANRIRGDRVPTYESSPRRRPEGIPEGDPTLDQEALERLRNLGYID